LSLPPLWLGQLACILKMPAGVPLLRAAWRLGGSGAVAGAALAAILQRRGPAAAQAQAARWLQQRPRPEIASFAGMLAVDAGDLETARDLLARGRQLGDDRTGALDLLEYFIAARTGQGAQVLELARRFQDRRDLPSLLSKAVLSVLMWDALEHGRGEEARRRALHLLEVDLVPEAEMVLWALHLRDGDHAQAEVHLERSGLPPPQRSYYQFLGSLAVGRTDHARQFLLQLRDLDGFLAGKAEAALKSKEPGG
jgi:hypothetical protein